MEPNRISAGFHAVQLFANSVFDVTKISLTKAFEKNKKWLTNRSCDMLVLPLVGAVYLEIEGRPREKITILGGALFIPRGTKYRWILTRRFVALYITNPPWNPEQHEVLEKT